MNVVFLDIGSGNAKRAKSWLDSNIKAHVFCFDPRPECYEAAKQIAPTVVDKHTKLQRMHPVKLAVTSTQNKTFHYVNDRSSSGLLPIVAENTRQWLYPPGRVWFTETNVDIVETTRMDKFLSDRRIDQVIFARIETQGSALDVLHSFGKRLSTVLEFAVKVHTTNYDIYQGQTKRDELVDFMNTNGFGIYDTLTLSRGQEEMIWFVHKSARNSARLRHFDLIKDVITT